MMASESAYTKRMTTLVLSEVAQYNRFTVASISDVLTEKYSHFRAALDVITQKCFSEKPPKQNKQTTNKNR